jgi:hypothetical protein
MKGRLASHSPPQCSVCTAASQGRRKWAPGPGTATRPCPHTCQPSPPPTHRHSRALKLVLLGSSCATSHTPKVPQRLSPPRCNMLQQRGGTAPTRTHHMWQLQLQHTCNRCHCMDSPHSQWVGWSPDAPRQVTSPQGLPQVRGGGGVVKAPYVRPHPIPALSPPQRTPPNSPPRVQQPRDISGCQSLLRLVLCPGQGPHSKGWGPLAPALASCWCSSPGESQNWSRARPTTRQTARQGLGSRSPLGCVTAAASRLGAATTTPLAGQQGPGGGSRAGALQWRGGHMLHRDPGAPLGALEL